MNGTFQLKNVDCEASRDMGVGGSGGLKMEKQIEEKFLTDQNLICVCGLMNINGGETDRKMEDLRKVVA